MYVKCTLSTVNYPTLFNSCSLLFLSELYNHYQSRLFQFNFPRLLFGHVDRSGATGPPISLKSCPLLNDLFLI